MSHWPLVDIRTKIVELASTGMGGIKPLELIARGRTCAPTECDQLDFKLQVSDGEAA